jgi:hypothetical protein
MVAVQGPDFWPTPFTYIHTYPTSCSSCFYTPQVTRTASHSVRARVSTTRCICSASSLSLDFTAVGSNPYVYSKTNRAALGLVPRTFITNTCGHMTILMRFDFTISNNRFPSTCGPAGILGDSHTSHILPARGSDRDYLNFLRTCLSWLLEDISLNLRLHMWFQEDGAPLHPTVVKCVNGVWKSSWTLKWSQTWSSNFLARTLTWLESSQLLSWGIF